MLLGVFRGAGLAEIDAIRFKGTLGTQPHSAAATRGCRLTIGVNGAGDLALHRGGMQRLFTANAILTLVLV
jgi:hypothetical protein